MTRPPLEELRVRQRDGTSQAQRPRPELVGGSIGIDERRPAELIAFARRFASQLIWYDEDNRPAGWWAALDGEPMPGPNGEVSLPEEPPRVGPAFFDGVGPSPGGAGANLSYEEVADFLADPASFAEERYAGLRRPHMALFLTAVRLMAHGQRSLNGLIERHLAYHYRDVLRLKPRLAEPDRAYVLFELGAGIAAAEAAAGTRLLAGRDKQHRDRIYSLDHGLVVNRAQVAQLASTFVDRDVIGLADAYHSITGTTEEQFLFMMSLALGEPRPGDPLPPFRKAPMTRDRLVAIETFIGFSRSALFLELFELRAMLGRKDQRDSEEKEWHAINRIVEKAGRAKRGDPNWKLEPAKPSDLYGNIALALGGEPDLGGLTEVVTIDDLALHLDREEVRTAIKTKLFMNVEKEFVPMMAMKRAIDADWRVVNGYLEVAGRRKRKKPGWTLPIEDQAAFSDNLAKAIGQVDYTAAGPEAEGVGDPDAYLTRLEEIEGWFYLPAEDAARLIATYGADDATPAGARSWREAYSLLAGAHGRKVRAQEAEFLRKVRLGAPVGTGPAAELEAALGELPGGPDAQMDELARYVPAEDVEFVRPLFTPPVRRFPEATWQEADKILADARRHRLGLSEPVAEKRHWRALWAYHDARTARPSDAAPAWRCFGGIPSDAGPEHTPALIGWAVASPALAMTAGRRRIVVTLGFHDDGGGPLVAPVDDHGSSAWKIPFMVSLSGEKDWVEPTTTSFAQVAYAKAEGAEPVDSETPLIALQVTITFDEGAAAIEPSPATLSFGETPWPVLRLLLRPVWDEAQRRFDTAYERFRHLKLARVNIAAAVGEYAAKDAPGLWPLAVETEDGPADGKKPFEPFGATPSVGSELALGHRDLLHKRLTHISLWFEWLGASDNLARYYSGYDKKSFEAQLSLIDGAVRTTALNKPQKLFKGENGLLPVRISLATEEAARLDPVIEPIEAEVRDWRRYLVMRLSGDDFGHAAYSSLVSGKAVKFAEALRDGVKPLNENDYKVNPPYTPKLKRIGLDFKATHEINVERYEASTAIDRLFHIHPFGTEEFHVPGGKGIPLLPAYDEEGALYVGLTDVDAPQSLSLLFTGVESGGGHGRTGPLHWSYLDKDGWAEFDEPPDDDTLGFVRRGIVRFALPKAQPGSRMPGGLYWLRATMPGGAANACDLIDVHAQAASAHYVDEGGGPEHYLEPLPKETIRSLGDPVPGIARVIQPYPSSRGRPAESDDAFRTRSAERLRHKGRALTLWDYERLVLERFAQVHKIKCLPANMFDDRPGMVKLVVIPDIRGGLQANAFYPRASAQLLDEIAAFLAPLTPPTASIQVVHARFVQVRVRIGVRFRPGGDEDFNKRRLSEALNRYLAPWAFDEGSDIVIGQRIDATSIVAFIDRLPYVDFVGVCRLFVSDDDGVTFRPGAEGGESVETQSEDGVLTPAPRHEIDIISEDLFEQAEFTGIGYMKVELDFTVQ